MSIGSEMVPYRGDSLHPNLKSAPHPLRVSLDGRFIVVHRRGPSNPARLGLRVAQDILLRVKVQNVKQRRRSGVLTATQSHGRDHSGQLEEEDWSWPMLMLLRRKLSLAVQEEDFERASMLHREVESFLSSLPANKQVLFALLDKINRQNTGPRERITATQQLGDLGDFNAVPVLMDLLHEAGDIGSVAEASLWSIFMHPPGEEEATMLLHRGMAAMARPSSWPKAEQCFTRLISIAPDFAEAWNKRATVLYLMHRFEDSIKDCKKTLQLNPYHFGAATGMGICLAKVGRYHDALHAFEFAMSLNPRLALQSNIETIKEVIKDGNMESNEDNL